MVEPEVWNPPTREEIQARSNEFNLGMTPELVDVAMEMGGTVFAGSYNVTSQWWSEVAPTPPTVEYTPGEDKWHAVQWKFRVKNESGFGPLDGITLAVKETVRVAGVPVGYGSRLIEGSTSAQNATVIDRVLDAGATVTHSTRSDDLGLAITGDQNFHGPVRNPWNLDHVTWGSSSGGAALVAAGEVDAAILIDQAGSCRVPAAGNGLAALLPTRGTVPMTGILGFTAVQDRVGFAALRTETVARLASVCSGGDGLDLKCGPNSPQYDWYSCLTADVQGMRIGVVREAFTPEMTDPETASAVRAQAEALAALGADVREVSIPRYGDAAALALVISAQIGSFAYFSAGAGYDPTVLLGNPDLSKQFHDLRAGHPEWMARTVRVLMASCGYDSGQQPGWWSAKSMGLIPEVIKSYQSMFEGTGGVDLLLTPTAPSPPPPLPTPEMSLMEELGRALGPGITHTAVTNLTGFPAGQVPAGLVGGLPVGVQLTAAPMRELDILWAMAALEPEGGFPKAPQE